MAHNKERRPVDAMWLPRALVLSGLCLLLAGCGRGASPREKHVEVLFNQIRMHTADERLAAIRALGQLRETSAVQPLIRLLYEPRADVREAAAEALGRIGDSQATEHIVKLLVPPHEWPERKAAANALGALRDPAAVPPLIEALSDEKETVAYSASVALSSIGYPALAPVVDVFRTATNGVKTACVAVVSLTRDPEALPALRALLAEPAPRLRLAAAQALCGARDTGSIQTMVALLDDTSTDVSKGVHQALLPWGNAIAAAVGQGLVSGLRTAQGRLAAIDILDKTGGRAMVQPLLTVMSDPTPDVSKAARKVLQTHAREPVIVPLLREAMQGADPQRALSALLVAQDAGGEETVAAVADALKSPDVKVRRAAVDLLGAIADDATLTALVSALTDKDELVRVKAALVLARKDDDRGKTVAVQSVLDAADRMKKTESADKEAAQAALSAAIETATRVKALAASAPLLALAQHPDPKMAGLAIDGLGALGERDGALQLVPLLKSVDAGLVRRTVQALGRMRNPDVVPALRSLMESSDKELVGLVVEALGRVGDPSAMEPLVGLLKSGDEGLRHRAIAGLGYLGDRRAFEHLAPLLRPLQERAKLEAEWRNEDQRLQLAMEAYKKAQAEWQPKQEAWEKKNKEWEALERAAKENGTLAALPPRPQSPPAPQAPVRSERAGRPKFETELLALEALGNLGDPRAIDLIVPLFEGNIVANFDSTIGTMQRALDALSKIKDPRASAALCEAFEKLPTHRYWHWLRLHGLRAVVRADAKAAVPVVANALTKSEPMDYDGLKGILKMAGEIGDERIFPTLLGLLRHDIPKVREQTRDAFAAIGSRDVDALIDYMGDESVSVGMRSYVCLIFPKIGPQALPALFKGLEGRESPQLRQGVAWSIGHIADSNGVPALLRAAAEDKHPKVRGAAVWALGQIKDPRTVEPLLRFVRDKDPETRMAAAISLGQLADARARDGLIEALKDEVTEVREAAALALGRIGDEGARPALRAALEDKDGSVRGMAGRALLMLDSAARAQRGETDE